ncbi:MAG: hypothetical protein QQN63_13690, partial [Nitrosopumilus sp.]
MSVKNRRETEINLGTSGARDAFTRLRVSNPTTIFDSKQIFDNAPLFWDDQEVSGAGTTSTYSKDNARSRLAVSASTAGKRVRQTFMRFNYNPGKSQLCFMTGVLGAGAAGITQEIGMHDDNNGVLFQCKDGVIRVIIRSSVSGSAVDEVVTQAEWNLDTLDGAGKLNINPSEHLAIWSNNQVFMFDYEWLGTGRVRLGIVIGGEIFYVHEFLNANVRTTVYMSTPNLPLRYSIENDGTGGAAFLDHICSSVSSEGGADQNGIIRHVESAGTVLDAASTNVFYALLGMRLKSTHFGATVLPLEVGISEYAGSKFYAWHWLLNPTVA